MRATIAFLLLLACAGCVERRLFIRTEPAGAIVHVNGEQVGRSPVNWRFYHYGKVLVEVERPGYDAESRVVDLEVPWYQRPVIDFFADVLSPDSTKDFHYVSFELNKLEPRSEEEIQAEIREVSENALALRDRAREKIPDPDDEEESTP